jgi:hypothetical protein
LASSERTRHAVDERQLVQLVRTGFGKERTLVSMVFPLNVYE